MASQKLNAEIIAELSGAVSHVPNRQQEHQQTRKDMIIDDFSSSSEQEDDSEEDDQDVEKHTH